MPTRISFTCPGLTPFVTSTSNRTNGFLLKPQRTPLTTTVVFKLFCGKVMTNDLPARAAGTSTRQRYHSRWANSNSGLAFLSLGTAMAFHRGSSGNPAIGSATGPGKPSSCRQTSHCPSRATAERSPFGAGAGSAKTCLAAFSSASFRSGSPGLNFECGWNGPALRQKQSAA